MEQFGKKITKNPILNLYEGVLNMFHVLNLSEFWIFANFRKYGRVLNMRRDAIMEGFWISQDSEYARFLQMQASHKVLNMSEYHALIMSQYAWIGFNKAEYDWIYRYIPRKIKLKKQSANYVRILNVPDVYIAKCHWTN